MRECAGAASHMSFPDARPAVAIIANSLTPYRLNLHQRLARDIPEIRLWSVFTHHVSNAHWSVSATSDIGPIYFGAEERSQDQSRLMRQPHEWGKAGQIIRWLRQQRVRCVILFGYNDAGRLRILRFCRQHRLPCLIFGDSNILCDHPPAPKRLIKKLMLPRVLGACAAVLHCGTLGRAYFEKYGVPATKLFPFPYEPDYSLLKRVPQDLIASVRQRFQLLPDRAHLLYSGRLAPEKRVDLLLRAFAQIASERPRWNLVIAGDGPLRERLRELVPAHLTPRVRWTGFIDDTATMAAIYRCCDVFVLPSDYEPWGVAVTEAATGLALVCSSVVGAAADLIQEGVNGRVFPRGDSSGLLEALRDVTRDEVFPRMKELSPVVLAAWHSQNDPVIGLRRALASAGVLT